MLCTPAVPVPTQPSGSAALPNLEAQLLVEHAGLIIELETKISDDPVFACCSYGRHLWCKDVTSLRGIEHKFN